jgi:WS/DGAT/MGAT family acyltransferase
VKVDPRVAEPMSGVDSSWLHMEGATNRMMVVGVLVFDEPVEFERLRKTVETRMLRFSRFRQKAVRCEGGARWEIDPEFDLDRHLTVVTLPAPGDHTALQDYVSDLMSEELDPDRPLWRFDLISDYEGGSAVVCRLHHCIADGIALIYVMLSMADETPDAPLDKEFSTPGESEGPDRLEALGRMLGRGVGKAANAATGVVAKPGMLMGMLSKVSSGTAAAGKLALMPSDPSTVFKGPLVAEKRAVWTRPLNLDLVKRIGRSTGSTVNDVLLAAVSGALRSYLVSRGQDVRRRLNVRAVVPVNLRPIEEAYKLGNEFGLVFLSLPLGEEEALDRIFEVRKRMNAIKNSPEAFLAFQILRAIGKAPRSVFDTVLKIFGAKATAVMTNVIGPKEPIFLAGARMREAMFWVPRSAGLGLGVSILSYDDRVWLGIATDAGLVPDPETILQAFHDEFDDMSTLVTQLES